MLYVLIVYSFNNQIRFNSDGKFNLPVGKRDFNTKMAKKLSAFIDVIKNQESRFTNNLLSKRKKNYILSEWLEKNFSKYFVHRLNYSYANSNYHTKYRADST